MSAGKPVGRLDAQGWMSVPATRRVLDALAAGGAAVRFVGGCVRDAVAGRPVKDIDLATPEPPEQVMALLERAGIHVIPTGLKHGTVTAVADHRPFEITTLRRDVETYGRHARVAFTDDWVADAARRDFTMNALSCAPDGTLFDPFGGIPDLHAGRVRFVGDPRQRIQEDVLRLLRFFRFHAWYGRPPPDAEALAACAAMAPQLPTLSAERVRSELLRLLLAPEPAGVLDLMRAHGVLQVVLPEATDTARLAALTGIEEAMGLEPDAIRRLAALLHVAPDDAGAIARRLRFSNDERARIRLLAGAPGPPLGEDERGARRALYALGTERYGDLALLAAASRPADRDLLDLRLRTAAAWEPVRLPVSGADLAALGVAQGPDVGRLLSAVEAWWIAGDFRADADACRTYLRSLVSPPS